MFRNKKEINEKSLQTINCLVSEGGTGDLLCSLMAINYILKNSPWVDLLIYVPDFMKDFTKHVLPKTAKVFNYTQAKSYYDKSLFGITTKWTGQHTPLRTHAVKYSFHVLCDYSPTIEEMSYLKINSNKIDISKFNLPNKYVVLPGATTEKVKTIPVETMNNLIDYIIEKGYTPVFLGKTLNKTGYEDLVSKATIQTEYNLHKGINLIDKTDLLESAAILDNAKLYIGIDGGITHLCGFTSTPIVCAYTFIKPETQMVIRDGIIGKNVYVVEPNEDLACRGCQSNWTLFFDHDFRDCKYKDFLCVKQITFDKYKNVIEKNNLL